MKRETIFTLRGGRGLFVGSLLWLCSLLSKVGGAHLAVMTFFPNIAHVTCRSGVILIN